MKLSLSSGKRERSIPFLTARGRNRSQLRDGVRAFGAYVQRDGESVLSAESTTKAWQLRDRVSDRERFFIDFIYDRQVTGNLEKAYQTLELWIQTYPRRGASSQMPRVCWAGISTHGTGRFERAIEAAQEGIATDPDSAMSVCQSCVGSFLHRTASRRPRARFSAPAERKLEMPTLSRPAIQHRGAKGRPGADGPDCRLWQEEIARRNTGWPTRRLSLWLVPAACRPRGGRPAAPWNWPCKKGNAKSAASYQAARAVWEAVCGNAAEATEDRHGGARAFQGPGCRIRRRPCPGVFREFFPIRGARRRFGEALPGRYVCEIYLRTGSSRVSRTAERGKSADSVERLEIARSYELAANGLNFPYLVSWRFALGLCARRGFAWPRTGMRKRRPSFRRFSIIAVSWALDPIGALAHLQLGRVFALSGDKTKAKAAYEAFLALWKDADRRYPDPEKRQSRVREAVATAL